jgi:protein tyrosine phosphatase
MLCKLKENDKTQCDLYWPKDKDSEPINIIEKSNGIEYAISLESYTKIVNKLILRNIKIIGSDGTV